MVDRERGLRNLLLVGLVIGFTASNLFLLPKWLSTNESSLREAVPVSTPGLELRIRELEAAFAQKWSKREIANVRADRTGELAAEVLRGASATFKCGSDVDNEEGAIKTHAKSQDGEDMHLYKSYFEGLCGGSYIELGALDGVSYSNSHMFNKALGWKGLLIEGDPRNFNALKRNRQSELAVVHSAVCREEALIHYMPQDKTKGGGAVAGIYEFAAERFRKVWWPGKRPSDGIAVTCKPLQKIIDENFGTESPVFFDFFSLDIEGAELQALESINYTRTSFGIIFVECDSTNMRKNIAVRTVLERKGYRFLGNVLRSYWFINAHFHDVYRKVMHIS